jgi:hypothetical protein
MARKRVTIKEAVSEPSVEVLDESTPKNTVDEVQEQVEVVSKPIEEVVNISEEDGNNEEVVEETVPKLKRRKRLSPEKMVDEAIKKNNLPVYDEEHVLVETLKFEKEKIKKKTKPSRKQLAYAKRKHEMQVEKKILEGDNAAYVQLVKEKKKVKKIIRYNTDLNTGLSSEVVEHRQAQGLANTKNVGSTKTIPTIILSNIFTFFNLLNFAIAAWIISAMPIAARSPSP